MVAQDRVDFAIATGSESRFADLTLLPCYRWHRTVVVPHGHALAARGDSRCKPWRASARHVLVQLLRPLVVARGVRESRPHARRGDHGARCGRHQDLRAARPRRRHRRRAWRWIRARMRTSIASTPRICSPGTPRGSVSAAACCCAATCTTSCSCSRRTSTGAGRARASDGHGSGGVATRGGHRTAEPVAPNVHGWRCLDK